MDLLINVNTTYNLLKDGESYDCNKALKSKMVGDYNMTIKEVVQYLENIHYQDLTINEVQCILKQNKDEPLVKYLLLCQVLKCTSTKLTSIIDRLSNLSEYCSDMQNVKDEKSVVKMVDLMTATIKHLPDTSDDVTPEMIQATTWLNSKGLTISEVYDLFYALMVEKMDLCKDVVTSQRAMTTQEFIDLCEPLNSIEKQSVSDMYHVIETMRTQMAIKICGTDNLERFIEVQDKYEAWLADNPIIVKYLDPYFVIVELASGGAIPGTVAAAVATLPPIINRICATDIGGANFAGVYRCATKISAYSVASIIRCQHGDGHGGGGDGADVRILIVQTNTAVVQF
jgi:hypothetical protein